ncbi:hypothetical protein AO375_1557 [Moraxella catarrhalis]|nr:hypothetical protein AO375_1557 [Moraxella catarrhalis]
MPELTITMRESSRVLSSQGKICPKMAAHSSATAPVLIMPEMMHKTKNAQR